MSQYTKNIKNIGYLFLVILAVNKKVSKKSFNVMLSGGGVKNYIG